MPCVKMFMFMFESPRTSSGAIFLEQLSFWQKGAAWICPRGLCPKNTFNTGVSRGHVVIEPVSCTGKSSNDWLSRNAGQTDHHLDGLVELNVDSRGMFDWSSSPTVRHFRHSFLLCLHQTCSLDTLLSPCPPRTEKLCLHQSWKMCPATYSASRLWRQCDSTSAGVLVFRHLRKTNYKHKSTPWNSHRCRADWMRPLIQASSRVWRMFRRICFSFFTFRSARHLDGKHTVFGRVVGGLEVLDALEKVKTDKSDKPQASVFSNCEWHIDEK